MKKRKTFTYIMAAEQDTRSKLAATWDVEWSVCDEKSIDLTNEENPMTSRRPKSQS
jgi:hypothetical protein